MIDLGSDDEVTHVPQNDTWIHPKPNTSAAPWHCVYPCETRPELLYIVETWTWEKYVNCARTYMVDLDDLLYIQLDHPSHVDASQPWTKRAQRLKKFKMWPICQIYAPYCTPDIQ